MLYSCGDIRFDSRKDITVPHSNSKSPTPAHGIAREVDSLRIDLEALDRPPH